MIQQEILLTDIDMDELKRKIKSLEGKRTLDSDVEELQLHYRELSRRLQGAKMKCVAVRDLHVLSEGEVCDFVRIEAGIFSTSYTTVRKNDGKLVTGHSYRFKHIEE